MTAAADTTLLFQTLVDEQQWDQLHVYFSTHPEEKASVMVDSSRNWTKLHLLCSLGSTPSLIIDLVAAAYPEAITMPETRYGDTPLHLACRNAIVHSRKPIFLLQRWKEYQEGNKQLRLLESSTETSSSAVLPSSALSPKSLSRMEGVLIRNRFGGTALHSACNHNAAQGVLEALVQANPELLSITTFDGIHAISALFTAYIQTIPGYITVARLIELGKEEDFPPPSHFCRFWNKVVFLATADLNQQQVPDPSRLVLHGLLFRCHLLVNFYKLALKYDPELAQAADGAGDLALHLLVDRRPFRLKEREAMEATLEANPLAASQRNCTGDFPLLIAIRNKIPWQNGLDLLTAAAPTTIQRRDVQTNLLPFQLAASVGGNFAVDTTFELLSLQPDLLLVGYNNTN